MAKEKTGGRQKGTPNKVTTETRKVLSKIVNDYFNSEELITDIQCLKAKERLEVMEKLTAYVIPKLQNVSLDASSEVNMTIENRLQEMSGE